MELNKETIKRMIKEIRTEQLLEATKISKTLRVEVGDYVLVGFEGTRRKYLTSVKRIKPNGDIVDTAGNTYDSSGRLKRRTANSYKFGWLSGSDPGNKNVQLQIYDIEDRTEDFRETLKRYLASSFNKLTLDQMKQIADIANVTIGDVPHKET